MGDLSQQEETLFEAARKLTDAEQRAAFLDAACAGKRPLRERVEQLLDATAEAELFFGKAPEFAGAASRTETAAAILSISEKPGDRIGRYKLLQQIGEGGCGIVYVAEQEEPVRRRVALKVIKLGMDTRDVIARFEAERQALAMMDHPNIAKVYDAGATETGRPYFVMELVRGVRITEYCDQNRLPMEERLKIFVQVCRAVQHAHQKGVIHRDIKPSNILVMMADEVPVPKMIDFGIAKAIGKRLTDKTVYTQFEQFIGTPTYMSPEQAGMSGLDVDTRSDIYSLGVLLYELVSGHPPFEPQDLARAGLDEIIRRIREEEPPKPSTRLSRLAEKEQTSTAQRRATEPPKLIRSLRGDLDWIVMKCLEKNRTRRYETAGNLAQDLERHLKQEPILARPPSNAYRARKFIRRNRAMVTAAVICTCLAIGTAAGAMLWLHRSHINWAQKQAVPEMERLTEQGGEVWEYAKFRQALELGQRASRYAPTDPRLKQALDACSSVWSITSEPPGAQVSLRPYDATNATWEVIGRTPIQNARFARGFFVVRLQKPGYEPVEAVGGAIIGPGDVSRQLDPINTMPAGMTRVPGRNVPRLGDIPSFFVDKYEVTNRRFKEFVDAGGYRDRPYWKEPFVRDGKVLTWEEAMSLFRDTTGQPGPAGWASGNYPQGSAEHPVAGVSWYEAAAYAAYANKSLPTTGHWAAAAGFDLTPCQWYFPSLISAHSNFHLDRTAPVGAHQGINRFGALDMAGNLREWCWNESPNGRFIRGGAWDSPTYMYSLETQQSPWDRSPQNGFRCVTYLDREKIPARLFAPSSESTRDFGKQKPVTDEVFKIYQAQFQYDSRPLNAKVEEHDDSAPDWIRERVAFDAAYDSERMMAQVYLPRNGRAPYQSVMVLAGAVVGEKRAAMESLLVGGQHLDCFLKSGRAVVFPIVKGTFERTGDMTYAKMMATQEYRHAYTDVLIKWIKDFRRCVDYLQSRPDLDGQKIGFGCGSWSGYLGMILPAIEPRVRANIIMISGLPDTQTHQALPEAHPLSYLARVKAPTLMLNGQYDMFYPVGTSVNPAFELLGTAEADKRLVIFPTDHYLPSNESNREILAWLDKHFGVAQ